MGSVLVIMHFGFLFSGAPELLLQWHVLGLPGTFCEVWTDWETGKPTPVAEVTVPVEVYVTVLCPSSYLEHPLHRYGCEYRVFLLERAATEPLSLPFLPSPLRFSQQFPSGSWSGVCRHIFIVPVWKIPVLPSKRKFFCLFCLLRDMWVLSRRIWIPWWRAA